MQRGLIGKGKQGGNHLMYQTMAARHEHQIEIYGVPVKGRELLGVLHLKGFIFDDILPEARFITLRFAAPEVIYAGGMELACAPATVVA